jgi:hypothetical protein
VVNLQLGLQLGLNEKVRSWAINCHPIFNLYTHFSSCKKNLFVILFYFFNPCSLLNFPTHGKCCLNENLTKTYVLTHGTYH